MEKLEKIGETKKDPRIPQELIDWKNMSDPELEEAFERTQEDFKRKVYDYLNRTETSIRWLLRDLEKSKGEKVFGFDV